MDCQQFLLRMSDYWEGELAASEAQLLDEHRAACARCRVALANIEQMRRLFADERFFAMPEGASGRLHDALVRGLDEPLAPTELRPAAPSAILAPAAPRRRSWLGFGTASGRLRGLAWAAAAAVIVLAVSVSRWQASASTTSGWLIDHHCYAAYKAHPGDHPSDCFIKCATAGKAVGIEDAQGHFHPFNEQGRAKAIAAVEASHRKNHLWVTVQSEPSRGPDLNVVALTLGQPAAR
jgi:hypothetical protein